ncbi:MAG: segregation/condensation protein A [Deltaproteobacteria bacterium]|nr:segregation/condensation protein A [Deltaproteobacteria bacterium]
MDAPSENAASADDPRPAAEPQDPTAAEVQALLGDDVRSPVGIPKQYRPNETSAHTLLRVELGDFAGPLDLLLYLIRQHDLDVFDIPIAFIIEKYLAMLDAAAELPLDVAAEFLVMAAELAHIKSKMLLPPKEGVPVEADEEDLGDPRADLVRRLLEYQKYRDASRDLADRDQLGRDVFSRVSTSDAAIEDFDPGLRDLSIFRLVEAMADVLSRLEPEAQHEVIADTVTINERIRYIFEFGAQYGDRIPFLTLFEGVESRRVVVVTFLAILELARTRALKIEQEPAPSEAATAVAPDRRPLPMDVDVAPAAPEESAPDEDASTLRAAAAVMDAEADRDDVADAAAPEERPRPRHVAELPPLRAPEPGEIVLVLTGAGPDLALAGAVDYR